MTNATSVARAELKY